MAGQDTGKWVARAGSTGGGRSYRGHMPVRWYGSLVLIVLLGLALVTYSRYERQHPVAAPLPNTSSHWYAALGFYLCDQTNPQPNLGANPNEATAAPGLHTTGDGVIQISPSKQADEGANATLARFVKTYPGLVLTSNSVGLPGERQFHNGQACPSGTPDAGKKAYLTIKVWPSFVAPGVNHPFMVSDPASLKLVNGQLISVSFGPKNARVPKPPATVIASMLQDQSQSSSTSTTAPATITPTTPSSTTTSAPSSTTTTTKP
ncbi:MAG: hypothetical protein ACYDD4_09975 [Acidimicrobiales bacterium]